MRWQTTALAEITHVVTKGTTPTTMGRQFTESGINFIKAEALNGDSNLVSGSFAFIDEDTHELLSRSKLEADDVLVTIAGAQVGRCGFVRPEHLPANTNQAVGIIRVDRKVANPRFVYYFFKQPQTFLMCQSLGASQAAQPNVTLTALRGFNLPHPKLEVQKAIADVLSAYDDLIENNLRRMQLLEESARLLYQEWFVRLRLPGHAHTRIINGIPEGWQKRPLQEICPDFREAANPAELEANTPYIGLEHMPRRSVTLNEWGSAGDVTSTKLRYRTGDILFGKIRPYFHKVGIALTDGVTSSDAIVLRPTAAIYHSFSLLTISSDGFVNIVSKTAKEGSKMPRADWNLMENHPVVVPTTGILESLNQTVEPLVEQLRTLAFANHKLRAARDLLLPRLMSGEISV